MKRKYPVTAGLLMIIILISACTPTAEIPTEQPEYEVVRLQITPALEHWLPEIAECAERLPNLGIYTDILPRNRLNLSEVDLVLRLGPRYESDLFVSVMGHEELIVFSGANVPVNSLSLESIQAIYSGTITLWDEVPEVIEEGRSINQPITTLAYPEDHEIRTLFELSYLSNEAIDSNPLLYNTVPFLEKLLAENPYGIGFGLLSQATEDSQIMTISDQETPSFQQFVLAITPEDPQGDLRQLLLCLQQE